MKCQSCRKKEAIGKYRTKDGKVWWMCETCSIGRPYVSYRRMIAKGLAVLDAIAIVLFAVWIFMNVAHI